jgi:hypothetical protein
MCKRPLNVQKSKAMFFARYEDNSEVAIPLVQVHVPACHTTNACSCPALEYVDTYKYLGVIIDRHLNWKPHVAFLSQKLRFATLLLAKLRNISSMRLLRTVYFAFFHSRMSYGLVSYGHTFDTTLAPLNVLQKRAIRIISKSHYTAHTAPLFANQGVLPLKQNFYFKCFCLHIKKPQLADLQLGNSTRIVNFRVPRTRTTRGGFTFPVKLAELMNQFPDARHCTKEECKTLLLSKL